MKPLTDFFFKLVNQKVGGVVQWSIGLLTGWLVSKAAEHSITIPDDVRLQFEQGASVAGAFIVTTILQWVQSHNNQQVQKAIGTTPDGWIGPETIQAAKEL